MRLLKLVPGDTNIDFLKWRKVASFMSFFLVVISIALVAVRVLNLGVDFVGGQAVHVEFTGEMPEIGDIPAEVGKIGLGEGTMQQLALRSEARREGEECFGTLRSRGYPSPTPRPPTTPHTTHP